MMTATRRLLATDPGLPATVAPIITEAELMASWQLASDRTTWIELVCWKSNAVTEDGTSYERLSYSLRRTCKDEKGKFRDEGKPRWRTHDLPVLIFLLAKAHALALEHRLVTTSEVPF
jgi:hypothetical protein